MIKLIVSFLLLLVFSCASIPTVPLNSMSNEELLRAYYRYDSDIKLKERQAAGYRSSGSSFAAGLTEPSSSEQEKLINMRIELQRRGIAP